MAHKKLLYLSWQFGLGHIMRDLAIVRELRAIEPEVEISWMSNPLSKRILEENGEVLLPESEESVDYNTYLDQFGDGFSGNVVKYFTQAQDSWKQNSRLLQKVLEKHTYNLIIGDEAYETFDAVFLKKIKLPCPMILLQDLLGAICLSKNPVEKLVIYYQNTFWAYQMSHNPPGVTHFFVGELDDIPNRRWGFLLPNLRETARKHFHCLGYIVRFDPKEWLDRVAVRSKLRYGSNPLIICATGGTAAGIELLELCGKAFVLLKEDLPDLHMVAVYGDLYGKKPPNLPAEIEVHNYLKDLYQHYAACDLAVVVGGGTTTTELAALRRPFLYFPLEDHFEQQELVSEHLERRNIGIRMEYSQTTPQTLAQAIRDNIGKEPDWDILPVNGAKKAAVLIQEMLARKVS